MKRKDKPEYKPADTPDVKIRIFTKVGEELVPMGDDSQVMIPKHRTSSTIFNSRAGFVRKFDSAQELWEKCLDYFRWADENPWRNTDVIRSGPAAGQEVSRTVDRPYLVKELLVWLNISGDTWLRYKSQQGFEMFHEVVEQVENIIESRKLGGAYTGAYNPMIASRDLGLVEKTEGKLQTENKNFTVVGMRVIKPGEE